MLLRRRVSAPLRRSQALQSNPGAFGIRACFRLFRKGQTLLERSASEVGLMLRRQRLTEPISGPRLSLPVCNLPIEGAALFGASLRFDETRLHAGQFRSIAVPLRRPRADAAAACSILHSKVATLSNVLLGRSRLLNLAHVFNTRLSISLKKPQSVVSYSSECAFRSLILLILREQMTGLDWIYNKK